MAPRFKGFRLAVALVVALTQLGCKAHHPALSAGLATFDPRQLALLDEIAAEDCIGKSTAREALAGKVDVVGAATVRSGAIAAGMSPREALLAWGRPTSAGTPTITIGKLETWCYRKQGFYTMQVCFEDDRVYFAFIDINRSPPQLPGGPTGWTKAWIPKWPELGISQ
jgi:hypothetical protein